MRAVLFVIAFAITVPGAEAAQVPVISCRAIGMTAEQGETMCIRTASGPRQARCGMVLNVSSWTFLDEACTLSPASEDDAQPIESEPAPQP